jgi:hypothetical protein
LKIALYFNNFVTINGLLVEGERMKTLCTLLVLSVLGTTFWACPAEASWVDKHMKRATTMAVESVKAIQSTKARGDVI